MLDSIFLLKSLREKQRISPLFAEREGYLRYLIEIGTRPKRLRSVATMLLHVVRLLELDSARPVGMDEIRRGTERWMGDPIAGRHRKSGIASTYTFQLVATNWLRFQGSLITDSVPEPRFGDHLSDFLNAMRSERGLALETLRTYRSQIATFLNWLHLHCPEFSNVQASDIEAYLAAKRSDGLSRSSISAYCRALRTFFGYAEQQRWCRGGIRGSIISPRLPRIAKNLSAPPWKDVRRLIASIHSLKPADIRAKAMLLLFSIYGFRSAEVRGLMLEDIDWRRGSITVRRAKRGKTQQFPLQNEVGEAIAQYLERARPKCPCRSLFVTLYPPYRPIAGHSMSAIICPRVQRLGMPGPQFGPHMLRRACATQLLRTGSSLKDIADFLGHSDMRSVGSYAKFDCASLNRVAQFSLSRVI